MACISLVLLRLRGLHFDTRVWKDRRANCVLSKLSIPRSIILEGPLRVLTAATVFRPLTKDPSPPPETLNRICIVLERLRICKLWRPGWKSTSLPETRAVRLFEPRRRLFSASSACLPARPGPTATYLNTLGTELNCSIFLSASRTIKCLRSSVMVVRFQILLQSSLSAQFSYPPKSAERIRQICKAWTKAILIGPPPPNIFGSIGENACWNCDDCPWVCISAGS